MKNLTKLTHEQEKLMSTVRDEWISIALSGDSSINTEDIEAGIRWLYSIAKLQSPHVVITDSPYVSVMAARALGAKDVTNANRMGLGYWSGWSAWMDFYARIGVPGVAGLASLREWLRFLRAGVWDVLLFERMAFVSRRPEIVRKDERGRLHCVDGPSVKFRDGFSVHSWHGTTVPQKAIEQPDSYTADELREETNSEVVRAIAERLGWDRYLEKIGSKKIDEWTDAGTGLTYELLDFSHRHSDQQPRMLRMRSPALNDGTQPWYVEPVPPDITTAQAARRWQFAKPDGKWPTVAECNHEPSLTFALER